MKMNVFPRFTCLLFTLLAAADSLIAAPPPNDNFANRINLGSNLPTSATGTNVDATEQAGEPLPSDGFSSVWWRWTAAAAGTVEINTEGSLDGADPLDTVLAVYTGTDLNNLVQIAVNDESASGSTSLLRFNATAGTAYSIQVLGWEGAEGSVKLNLKAGPPPPPNDDFANAVTLTTGVSALGNTDGATLQVSESVPMGVDAEEYAATAWWVWTAPSSGWYRLSVNGASWDQVASVWTGTAVNALVPVNSTDDWNGVNELFFQAAANTRYSIAIGNRYGQVGASVLLNVTSAAGPPISNASLIVSPGAVDVTNAPATVNAVFQLVSTAPVTRGSLVISNASGYSRRISFEGAQRTSGTDLDGIYTVPLVFPRGIESGPYRIHQIEVPRLTEFGVSTYFLGESLMFPFAAGALRSVTVINSGPVDTEAPTVTSVTVTPTTVDVTGGPKTITVTLQISDDLSGFSGGTIYIQRTSDDSELGRQFFDGAQRTAGAAQNGTYTISFTASSGTAPGDYYLLLDELHDGAGNQFNMTSESPDFPGPFAGTIRVNRTAVHVLNSFTLSPAAVDVTAGNVTVIATCSITSSSGEFLSGSLGFIDPTDDFRYTPGTSFGPSNRIAGTATSGTYSVAFSVPRYIIPGSYTSRLSLFGTGGAASHYGPGEFAFPTGAITTLSVANTGAVDTSPPVITVISVVPNSIVAGSSMPIVMRVRVTDPLSGVQAVLGRLPDPNFHSLGSATLISGTRADGVWELRGLLPSNIPVGVYPIQFSAFDYLHNSALLTTDPSNTTQSIAVTAPINGYTSWATANGLSGMGALATSDPDQDGTTNLMEFAMGMSPQANSASPASAAAAGLPAATLEGSGAARRLTLSFWVPSDLAAANSLKLSYVAQFSSNGTTWTDVPQSSFSINTGTSLNTSTGIRRFCTVTDPAAYSATQPRMGRIRVTAIP